MDRYNRNQLIKGIGSKGQKALYEAKVLVVGAGGLGSPCLLYLAAAGIGTIGIVEYDKVDISNLQRQILYSEKDIGLFKIDSAEKRLQALNSEIKINKHPYKLTSLNVKELFYDYDFIVDCSDNFETKYLINDTCVKLDKPFSFGTVIAMQGQVFTYTPGNSSLRNIFGPPPLVENQVKASQIGILGAMSGMIGSIQATEVVKYFTGIGELLINKLLIINGIDFSLQVLTLSPEK